MLSSREGGATAAATSSTTTIAASTTSTTAALVTSRGAGAPPAVTTKQRRGRHGNDDDTHGGVIVGPEERAQMLLDGERAAASTWPFPRLIRLFSQVDVCQWLATIGLAQYSQSFLSSGIDGELLVSFSPGELKSALGMEDCEHITRLLLARDAWAHAVAASRPRIDPLATRELQGMFPAYASSPTRIAALFAAVRTGRLQPLQTALKAGFPLETLEPAPSPADRNTDRDNDEEEGDEEEEEEEGSGRTLIMVAGLGQHIRIVDALLSRGADINHIDEAGLTLLDYYTLSDAGQQQQRQRQQQSVAAVAV